MVVESRLAQQQGFTLIESLVAMAILGVGLVSLAAMQGISLGRNVNANELGRVTNIAADMMERIKLNGRNALSYQGLMTNAGCGTIPAAQVMTRGDCTQLQALVNNSGLAVANVGVTVVQALPVALNQFAVAVAVTWTRNDSTGGGPQVKTVVFNAVVAPEF